MQFSVTNKSILTPAASERKSSDISDLASCRTIGTTSVSSSAAMQHNKHKDVYDNFLHAYPS